MIAPFCRNKSPRRLCEEIEKVLPPSTGRMVRRPFNHYLPTQSDWWIVPSLELPFFKFGKYFFAWGEEDKSLISCGFSVIKGLDPAVKKVYPSKKGRRLIMDESWGWKFFASSVASGAFGEIVRATGMELELIFEGGYIDDPGLFDPETSSYRKDRYKLRFDPADGSVRVRTAKRDAMTLKLLNKVRDWPGFAAAVAELDADAFMYCTLFVSADFRIKEYGELGPDDPVRETEAIYRDYLGKFREFVR